MMSFFSSRGSYFVFLGFGLLRLERAREGGREGRGREALFLSFPVPEGGNRRAMLEGTF